MFDDHRHQSPYRGFLISLLILIVPGVLFCLFIQLCSSNSNPHVVPLDAASCQALTCLFSLLCHMIALLCGLFTPGWLALKKRVSEFFEYLCVGFGYSVKSYWESIRMDGVTFDVQMAIVLVNLYLLYDGVRKAFPALFE